MFFITVSKGLQRAKSLAGRRTSSYFRLVDSVLLDSIAQPLTTQSKSLFLCAAPAQSNATAFKMVRSKTLIVSKFANFDSL